MNKGLLLSFSLILSLPSDLYGTSCSSCQKETWFLKEQADQILTQNLKDVYRQEFGLSSETAREEGVLPSAPRLYLFVSLSMPMAGLIELGKQAQTYGGVLVLRGLVEGSYRKTALKLQSFIDQTKAGMIVDPLLFRQYKIQAVPSLVVPSLDDKAFDQISGFISVKGALEEIQQKGEGKDRATEILNSASSQEILP